LARVTGLHIDTVNDSLKKLKDLGDIRILERRKPDGRNDSNMYIPSLDGAGEKSVDNRPVLRVVGGVIYPPRKGGQNPLLTADRGTAERKKDKKEISMIDDSKQGRPSGEVSGCPITQTENPQLIAQQNLLQQRLRLNDLSARLEAVKPKSVRRELPAEIG
jgi:hypothetical protein